MNYSNRQDCRPAFSVLTLSFLSESISCLPVLFTILESCFDQNHRTTALVLFPHFWFMMTKLFQNFFHNSKSVTVKLRASFPGFGEPAFLVFWETIVSIPVRFLERKNHDKSKLKAKKINWGEKLCLTTIDKTVHHWLLSDFQKLEPVNSLRDGSLEFGKQRLT